MARRTTREDIEQARKMRQAGATCDEISKAIGFGSAWVTRNTATAVASADLQLRARNLLKRGFDVPPSKQEYWEILIRKAVPLSERVKILELE